MEGCLITIFIYLCFHSSSRIIGIALHISQRVCHCCDMSFLIPGIYRVLWFFPLCSGATALCQMSHCIILVESLISHGIRNFCKITVWSVFIAGLISIFIFCLYYSSQCIICKIGYTSCRILNKYHTIKAVIVITITFSCRSSTLCKISLCIIAIMLSGTIRVTYTF